MSVSVDVVVSVVALVSLVGDGDAHVWPQANDLLARAVAMQTELCHYY